MGTIFLSPCLKGNFRQVFFPKPTNNIAPKYNATNSVYIHLTTICLQLCGKQRSEKENKDATHATLSLGGITQDHTTRSQQLFDTLQKKGLQKRLENIDYSCCLLVEQSDLDIGCTQTICPLEYIIIVCILKQMVFAFVPRPKSRLLFTSC